MKREDLRTQKRVLQLCRKINKRAANLDKLQPLVFQLNEVLRQVSYRTQTVSVAAQAQGDNPFDKIVLDGAAPGSALRAS